MTAAALPLDFDPDEILAQFSEEEIAAEIARMSPEAQANLAADAARSSFAEFVRQAWPIIEPDRLVWGWHLDALCIHLEAVYRGEIKRLLINIPPGHAKSLIVSVLFPAWLWVQDPTWRSLFASYAAQLAVRDSVKCRQLIESEWYQALFSTWQPPREEGQPAPKPKRWRLTKDQNAKDYFVTSVGGHRFATSVGAGGTGHRGRLMVIDDPLSAMGAHSKAERDEAIRWFGQTMSSRLNDLGTDSIVVIMQRLHVDDLSGWLLRGGGWEHLCLPSEYDPARPCITYHIVDGERRELWRDPRREAGELLFPAKFTREVLEAQKAPNVLGPDGYAGQHGQRPTLPGGGMFKDANWRFWAEPGAADISGQRPPGWYQGPANLLRLEELDELLISVDATFKKTKAGSYVAIHVWGRLGRRRLLLDRVHARMDFTSTVAALLATIARWPRARRKLIEGKANGDAIISTLENEHHISGIERVDPGDATKEQRAHAMQPYQASGCVELPDGAPWVPEYIEEHGAFPKAGAELGDDDVDAQSQALQGFEAPESLLDLWGKAQVHG